LLNSKKILLRSVNVGLEMQLIYVTHVNMQRVCFYFNNK
jgi:hypothetical protein